MKLVLSAKDPKSTVSPEYTVNKQRYDCNFVRFIIYYIELWTWKSVTYFKVQAYVKTCHVGDVTCLKTDRDLHVIQKAYDRIVLAHASFLAGT
jgi:hypothetical protein